MSTRRASTCPAPLSASSRTRSSCGGTAVQSAPDVCSPHSGANCSSIHSPGPPSARCAMASAEKDIRRAAQRPYGSIVAITIDISGLLPQVSRLGTARSVQRRDDEGHRRPRAARVRGLLSPAGKDVRIHGTDYEIYEESEHALFGVIEGAEISTDRRPWFRPAVVVSSTSDSCPRVRFFQIRWRVPWKEVALRNSSPGLTRCGFSRELPSSRVLTTTSGLKRSRLSVSSRSTRGASAEPGVLDNLRLVSAKHSMRFAPIVALGLRWVSSMIGVEVDTTSSFSWIQKPVRSSLVLG
ncbi:hypothetical protein SAMN05421773_10590 [Streptomyces aidingensis]|uniref:Uncharacterized protein n=1 Tax=Streptomyces aidingensis TaxID=910347 RepID=A0A1I1L7L9_9ACTN|nr:hypothetical protein SAMN05421773_10590 [Streptomyces aidingensis]